MSFNGTITFKGANGLVWIQKNDDGLIDIFFKNDDEEEVSLAFDPECFNTIIEVAKEFLGTGKLAKNPREGTCVVEADIKMWDWTKKVSLETDWMNPDESSPNLTISSKREKVVLGLTMAQFKGLRDKCQEILDVRQSIKDVQKKKTIKAEAV